jgi:hypothetical protein
LLAGLDAFKGLGEDGLSISGDASFHQQGLLFFLEVGLLLQGLLVTRILGSAAASPLEQHGQHGKAGNRRQHAKRGGESAGRWLCRG